jgi:radical SAM enzyme (TIGR01210 family)
MSSDATCGEAPDLTERVRDLYNAFGQRKRMGMPQPDVRKPLFFLHRPFLDDSDLLIIFNTKRCRYQCDFCHLPSKSPRKLVSGDDILAQFEYVLNELKHSLSVMTRLTLSNEGSMLDAQTFPTSALHAIVRCSRELRMVRRLVLETRLEFLDAAVVSELREINPRARFDILTGFETKDQDIRDRLLFKQETLAVFLSGLDTVAASGCELTAYVLFKPSPYLSDDEAFNEAESSIDFLADQCRARHIGLTIRLNPMYAAAGTKWAELARATPAYQPPRLTDVMKLAAKKTREGLRVYIGVSREGLDENWGSYLSRGDYSDKLLRPIKLFNEQKIREFA